jgi:indolepyruvate ferredoxin oxidoreductase
MQHIEDGIDNLNNDTHAHALRVAQVPENIKGFGHVKERNIQAARALWKSLQNG